MKRQDPGARDAPDSPAESVRDLLSREWTRLKALVRSRFDKLTDADVEEVGGRYDELSQRVSKTYGYDRQRTDEEISRFVSEGGNSALYATEPEPIDRDVREHERGLRAERGSLPGPGSPGPR